MGASDLDPYDISSRGPPPPPHRTVRPSWSSTTAAAGAILVCYPLTSGSFHRVQSISATAAA
ncbi:hypothetical protein CGRA01v4_07158 [Colletotrichum graminicola]|nr:hypothetical protein CGRA01v4_07158 [Colletotrichum graminicola]